MKPLFTLFTLLCAFSIQANTIHNLISLEGVDSDNEHIASTTLKLETNDKNEIVKIFVPDMPNKTIKLRNLVQKRNSKSTRKVGMSFLLKKLFDVKSNNFSLKQGGDFQLILPRGVMATRKKTTINLSLKFNVESGKWQVAHNNNIVTSVDASTNMKYDDMSMSKWPKISNLKINHLNCDTRDEYLKLTKDLKSASQLNCPDLKSVSDFYASSILPNIHQQLSNSNWRQSTDDELNEFLNSAMEICDCETEGRVTNAQKIFSSAVYKGHMKIVDHMLKLENNMDPSLAINEACSTAISDSVVWGDVNGGNIYNYNKSELSQKIRNKMKESGVDFHTKACGDALLSYAPYNTIQKLEYLKHALEIVQTEAGNNYSKDRVDYLVERIAWDFYDLYWSENPEENVKKGREVLAELVKMGGELKEKDKNSFIEEVVHYDNGEKIVKELKAIGVL
jgi:hypothetical protein